MNPEVKKAAEDINKVLTEKLTETFKSKIGTTVNVKEVLIATLNGMKDNLLIEDYNLPEISVYIIWKSWSIYKKLYWIWKMKLGFGKKEYNRYNKLMEHFNVSFADMDEVENKDTASWTYSCMCLEDLQNNFKRLYNKWWYCSDPKTVIISDFTIRPFQCAEFVKADVDIEL